jgi:hypothetical protein
METEMARLKQARQAARAAARNAAKALKTLSKKKTRIMKAAKGLTVAELGMVLASKAAELAAAGAAAPAGHHA